jgi:cytochrome P450
MHALTLEIILQVVFGVTDAERLAALRPLVRRIVGVGPLIMLGWFNPRLQGMGPWRRYAAVQRELDRQLYALIAERRTADDLADRDDVLSRLLRTTDEDAGDPLTDSELRDQLVTLLLAGHETTATALAWTLHELARRPGQLRAAQRAADEHDEEYLTAVAKETLRLRPVIYEVARKLTEPVEVGGYRLPAGAVVAPAIGLVQTDPRNHPEPDDFDRTDFCTANLRRTRGYRSVAVCGAVSARDSPCWRRRLCSAKYCGASTIGTDQQRPERQRARNITLVPARGARIVVRPRSAGTTTDR